MSQKRTHEEMSLDTKYAEDIADSTEADTEASLFSFWKDTFMKAKYVQKLSFEDYKLLTDVENCLSQNIWDARDYHCEWNVNFFSVFNEKYIKCLDQTMEQWRNHIIKNGIPARCDHDKDRLLTFSYPHEFASEYVYQLRIFSAGYTSTSWGTRCTYPPMFTPSHFTFKDYFSADPDAKPVVFVFKTLQDIELPNRWQMNLLRRHIVFVTMKMTDFNIETKVTYSTTALMPGETDEFLKN